MGHFYVMNLQLDRLAKEKERELAYIFISFVVRDMYVVLGLGKKGGKKNQQTYQIIQLYN